MAGEDWSRLASYVLDARTARGWNAETFAKAARVSTATISAVETGKPVRAGTLERVGRALDWQPGSARAILHGGEPTYDLVTEPNADPDDERARELMRRRAELAAAREALDAMIAELDGELDTRNARGAG